MPTNTDTIWTDDLLQQAQEELQRRAAVINARHARVRAALDVLHGHLIAPDMSEDDVQALESLAARYADTDVIQTNYEPYSSRRQETFPASGVTEEQRQAGIAYITALGRDPKEVNAITLVYRPPLARLVEADDVIFAPEG